MGETKCYKSTVTIVHIFSPCISNYCFDYKIHSCFFDVFMYCFLYKVANTHKCNCTAL